MGLVKADKSDLGPNMYIHVNLCKHQAFGLEPESHSTLRPTRSNRSNGI